MSTTPKSPPFKETVSRPIAFNTATLFAVVQFSSSYNFMGGVGKKVNLKYKGLRTTIRNSSFWYGLNCWSKLNACAVILPCMDLK